MAAVCLAVLGLGLSPAVGQEEEQAAGEVSGSQAALEALAEGRRAKGEGNLALAEVHFRDALAAAEYGGDTYQTALEELTYQLPLMRVERYVLGAQWQRAEQSLQDLLERHQSDEEKSRHLVQLIANLRKRAPAQGDVYAPEGGHKVVRQVEQTLDRFLEEHGRYPSGYRELNEILPAGRYPLEEYDIVHYVARGKSYGLTIRSRSDPGNLMYVQRTGLMK